MLTRSGGEIAIDPVNFILELPVLFLGFDAYGIFILFLNYFLQCRLLSLMKDAASSVSVEDIVKKHKIPSTHAYSSKSVVDKAITFGKVEGSVEV